MIEIWCTGVKVENGKLRACDVVICRHRAGTECMPCAPPCSQQRLVEPPLVTSFKLPSIGSPTITADHSPRPGSTSRTSPCSFCTYPTPFPLLLFATAPFEYTPGVQCLSFGFSSLSWFLGLHCDVVMLAADVDVLVGSSETAIGAHETKRAKKSRMKDIERLVCIQRVQ